MRRSDIGWAIEKMREGQRVRRTGWHGHGMWIALQTPDAHSANNLPYVYIVIPTKDDAGNTGIAHRVPWLASQTDLLADDWEIRS